MKHYKSIIIVILALLLLLSSVTPLFAADNIAPNTLPPLPEWPVIGPVLRWLGVAEAEPEPEPDVTVEAPLRDIPEYTIKSLDDVETLRALGNNESVRIIATDDTLNALAAEASADIEGLTTATVTFDQDLVSVYVQLDRTILSSAGIDFPLVRGQTLELTAEAALSASNCRVAVSLSKFRINRIGVAMILGGQINQIIQDNWPEQACVEDISVKPGEIIVEGYRQ